MMKKKLEKRRGEIQTALMRRLAMRQEVGVRNKTNEAMITVHNKALRLINAELAGI